MEITTKYVVVVIEPKADPVHHEFDDVVEAILFQNKMREDGKVTHYYVK